MEARLHTEFDGMPLDKAPNFDELLRLVYTKQIIDETLRLYRPVWLFTRKALIDDRTGDFYARAKADIFIALYFVHRHPEFWSNPIGSSRIASPRTRAWGDTSSPISRSLWVSVAV
jgi:cytochrome P450